MQIVGLGETRPFGIVDRVEATGGVHVSGVDEWHVRCLEEIDGGEPITRANCITGTPIFRFQLGHSLTLLGRKVRFSWANGHPGTIAFYKKGQLAPNDTDNTDVLFVARDSWSKGVVEGRGGFLLSEVEIEVDGERTPIFVNPRDARRSRKGIFSGAWGIAWGVGCAGIVACWASMGASGR